jgi:hypothetical protein
MASPLNGRPFGRPRVPPGHCEKGESSNVSPSIAVAESMTAIIRSGVPTSGDIARSMVRPASRIGMHGPSGPVDHWPPSQLYPTEGSDQPLQNGLSLAGSHGQPSAGSTQLRAHPHTEKVPRIAVKRKLFPFMFTADQYSSESQSRRGLPNPIGAWSVAGLRLERESGGRPAVRGSRERGRGRRGACVVTESAGRAPLNRIATRFAPRWLSTCPASSARAIACRASLSIPGRPVSEGRKRRNPQEPDPPDRAR